MTDPRVGVKATFSVQGRPVHQFSSSGATDSPPPAAAAAGIGQQGPVEGTDKYDYRYTGRHDHGTLPALRTGGLHGELAKALLDAKADSDAFLTGLIAQELAQKNDGGGARARRDESQRNPKTATGGAGLVGGGRGGGGGGGGGGQGGAEEAEPMELDGSGVGGDDAAAPVQGGGALPAKRPRA